MRLLAIAVLVTAAAATPAWADPVSIPGERAADAQVRAEVRVTVDFWRTQGVTGCPDGIRAFFVDGMLASDGRDHAPERGGDCAVWLDGTYADRTVYRLQPFRGRIEDAADECGLVAHGVGHALGLDHTDGGVMDADTPVAPWACRRWAPWWVAPRRWWRAQWDGRWRHGSGTTR